MVVWHFVINSLYYQIGVFKIDFASGDFFLANIFIVALNPFSFWWLHSLLTSFCNLTIGKLSGPSCSIIHFKFLNN